MRFAALVLPGHAGDGGLAGWSAEVVELLDDEVGDGLEVCGSYLFPPACGVPGGDACGLLGSFDPVGFLLGGAFRDQADGGGHDATSGRLVTLSARNCSMSST